MAERRTIEFTEVNNHVYHRLDVSLADVAAGKVRVVDSRRNRQPLSENQIHADHLLGTTRSLKDISDGKLQVVFGNRPPAGE